MEVQKSQSGAWFGLRTCAQKRQGIMLFQAVQASHFRYCARH